MSVLNGVQFSLFDLFNEQKEVFIAENIKTNIDWNNRLATYSLNDYTNDVKQCGLGVTWNAICDFLLNDYSKRNNLLEIENLSELYEIGLAIQNKQNKKEKGQYYTPNDVCGVMANWFKGLEGCNVCDVACGTGNLILSYFEVIGKDKVLEILQNGKLYLYDLDDVALKICKTIILLKYGKEFENKINDIHCDFLNNEIHLPKNCKVISNPPYASVKELGYSWEHSKIQKDTKELYSAFMEKIIKESLSSVIISPYSFIGGTKFYSLREMLNDYSGFIVSFDNVPGNIFSGKKYGIFNTNTSNSVRAAITVVNNCGDKGFRISPLIRFKNEERKEILRNDFLEDFLPNNKQLVSKKQSAYVKCFKELFLLYKDWVEKSDNVLKNYISSKQVGVPIYVPNTCRYFTTGSSKRLKRAGMITLNIVDQKYFGYIYCLINSSFAYWWWRLFDGGINYPIGLLTSMPLFVELLNNEDFEFFNNISQEMILVEERYIATKLNAGNVQENIKFPVEYRNKINKRLIKILQTNINFETFNLVHSNKGINESNEGESNE